MKKKILVLLSTYNGEKYLQEQLDSILQQELPENYTLNLLIRDDGSSDKTCNIIEEYKKIYSNIQLEKGNNIGVVPSFFALIKQAKGYDYYAFSDQDDVWMKDKLACGITALNTLDLSKPALYASCSLLVDNSMKGSNTTQIDRRGLAFNNVIIQNLMPGHTQICNQKLIDLVTSKTDSYKDIVVHDFWLALLAITFGNIYFDNTPHTYYRQHGNNSIGYGNGPFGWITERIRRVLNAAAKDITRQDNYFYHLFKEELTNEQKQELEGLLFSQRNIFTRIGYLYHAHVYRQKKFETMLFYILYLFGGYKIGD
ncbi:glycosyltransferase [Erysipelotrichaceae bacterium HCN-30851]